MFKFLKEIKDLKKTELWGIIILACFHLTAIIKALGIFDKMGAMNFFAFISLLSLGMTPLYLKLFHLYVVRLGVDDTHEAARNLHRTMELTGESEKRLIESVESYQKTVSMLQKQVDLQSQSLFEPPKENK